MEDLERNTDQSLEILRKIGIEQIKEDTKLDASKIEDILQKRFENLDSARARGFVYILEKEYDLDLSDWLKEYFLFCPQEEELESKKKNDTYQRQIKKKKLLLFCGAILIIMAVFVCVNFFFGKNTKKQERATIQLLPKEKQVKDAVLEVQQNAQFDAQDQKEILPSILTHDKTKTSQILQKEEEEEAPITSLVEKRPLEEIGEVIFDDLKEDEILTIEAKKALWLGVVDLENRKHNADSKSSFEIVLNRALMICTAYGKFLLKVGERKKEFSTYKPLYFIYTPTGGLKQIKKEEFIALNGGVEW